MVFISFIFMSALLLGRVAGVTARGGLEHFTVNNNFKWFYWLHTKMEPSKVGNVVTPPRPWTSYGWRFRDFSQQELPRHFPVAFWTYGRTNIAVISRFWEVVRNSGLCEFHSCALCREVSRQGRDEGGKGHTSPGRRITGDWRAPKSPNNVAGFSSI